MKLNIKRTEKKETIEDKISFLQKQNVELTKTILNLLQTQKEMAKKEQENYKVILKVNDFVKEVGARFRELSEYFEDNNENSNVSSLDYDKIALVLHKYNLIEEKK